MANLLYLPYRSGGSAPRLFRPHGDSPRFRRRNHLQHSGSLAPGQEHALVRLIAFLAWANTTWMVLADTGRGRNRVGDCRQSLGCRFNRDGTCSTEESIASSASACVTVEYRAKCLGGRAPRVFWCGCIVIRHFEGLPSRNDRTRLRLTSGSAAGPWTVGFLSRLMYRERWTRGDLLGVSVDGIAADSTMWSH